MKKEYVIYILIGLMAGYSIIESYTLSEAIGSVVRLALLAGLVRWLKKEYWPDTKK